MYQDLIVNNRKTEIDYINGAVATLGKQRHIEAPVNRFITDLIHTKRKSATCTGLISVFRYDYK